MLFLIFCKTMIVHVEKISLFTSYAQNVSSIKVFRQKMKVI